MAGEVKVVGSVTVSQGVSSGTKTVTLDWTASKGAEDKIVLIGTSQETISFTDIAIPGYMYLTNLDIANYIEVGFTTAATADAMKVPAGGFLIVPLSTSATVYAKANTAACRVRVIHVGG
jgi:hypothetical protein